MNWCTCALGPAGSRQVLAGTRRVFLHRAGRTFCRGLFTQPPRAAHTHSPVRLKSSDGENNLCLETSRPGLDLLEKYETIMNHEETDFLCVLWQRAGNPPRA